MNFYNYVKNDEEQFNRRISAYVKKLEDLVVSKLRNSHNSDLFYIVWMKSSHRSHWFRCIFNSEILFVRIDDLFLVNSNEGDNELLFDKEAQQLFENVINRKEEDFFTIIKKIPKNSKWKECINSIYGTYAYKRQACGKFIFIKFISLGNNHVFDDLIINDQIIENRDIKEEYPLNELKTQVNNIMFDWLKGNNEKNDWFNIVE